MVKRIGWKGDEAEGCWEEGVRGNRTSGRRRRGARCEGRKKRRGKSEGKEVKAWII